MIQMIVAMGEENEIGKDNNLLWHLPGDLEYFKKITLGKDVIMGRKTFESILHILKKPLPKRKNIVLTRTEFTSSFENVIIVGDLTRAMKEAKGEVFVIGGSEIYKQFMPYTDRLFVTKVKAKFDADSFFPEIDHVWELVSKVENSKDEKNEYDYDFLIYEKKK